MEGRQTICRSLAIFAHHSSHREALASSSEADVLVCWFPWLVLNARNGSKADIATHVVRRGNIRHYHFTPELVSGRRQTPQAADVSAVRPLRHDGCAVAFPLPERARGGFSYCAKSGACAVS